MMYYFGDIIFNFNFQEALWHDRKKMKNLSEKF